MMKLICAPRQVVLILAVLALQAFDAYTQNRCAPQPPRQSYNWFFGDRAAISFNDNGFEGSSDQNPIGLIAKGSSSISDSLGNLLLLTDGERLFNGNFQEITNPEFLHGDPGATQSSVIIPRPGHIHRFFVFTVDLFLPPPLPSNEFNNGFRFTEVDLAVNTGSLVPEMTNISLQPKVSEKVTAVRHLNGRDFWVVTHDLNSNEFFSYRVTQDGVDTIPVISAAGSRHDGEDPETNNAVGYMKLSPDGSKMAVAVFGKGILELFSFDNNTGQVSFDRNIPIQGGEFPYGVAFSPNSRYLYFTTATGISPWPITSYWLYQFDLQTPAATPIILNQDLIDDVTSLQLGPDGRIYVGRWGKPLLGVIQNPNRGGLFSSYIENEISLLHGHSRLGLPNFASCFLQQPHFYYDPSCIGDTTTFWLVNRSNIEETTTWFFGDPYGTPTGFYPVSPSFIFSSPGEYAVTVTENGNPVYGFSETITIKNLPVPLPDLPGNDSIFFRYPGSVLTIDGGNDFFSYLWEQYNNGIWNEIGSSRLHDFDEEGYFRITVEDQFCCVSTREFHIISLDVMIPNAFTPEMPQNNIFRAIGGQNVHNFVFSVFNRWGQMVHHETHASGTGTGWDGRFNGMPSPVGIYTYIATFEVEHESTMKPIVRKGTVMLLR